MKNIELINIIALINILSQDIECLGTARNEKKGLRKILTHAGLLKTLAEKIIANQTSAQDTPKEEK